MDKTSNSGFFESVGGFESRLHAEGRMCPQKQMIFILFYILFYYKKNKKNYKGIGGLSVNNRWGT
jgi:hypothetical protein